jgi:hypothetical protein
MTPYSLHSLLLSAPMSPMWSKVVHYVGNRVAFGTHTPRVSMHTGIEVRNDVNLSRLKCVRVHPKWHPMGPGQK